MFKKIVKPIKQFFFLFVCIIISGCTGLYYLASSDMEKKYETKSKLKARDIRPGTQIRIELVNQNQIDGKFVGIVDFPPDEYLKRYTKSLQAAPEIQSLPMPGDSVTIIKYTENEYSGLFLGFDHSYKGQICIYDFIHQSPIKLRLDDLKELRFNNNLVPGSNIREIIASSKIANLSALLIESGGIHRHFGMAEIEHISVIKGEGVKRYYLWYAISTDFLFLVFIGSSIN